MLITLYDMAGKMATGLRTLLRSFWRRLKTKYRNRRLMVDVASSVDEGVMLWGGCMKHSALIVCREVRLTENRQLLSHLRLEHVYSLVRTGAGHRSVGHGCI